MIATQFEATVQLKNLKKAITQLSKVIPSKSIKPILEYAAVSFNGHALIFMANDLKTELHIRLEVGSYSGRPGTELVPFKKLQAIVKTLNSDWVTIGFGEDGMTLHATDSLAGKMEIPVDQKIQDFPRTMDLDPRSVREVLASDVREGIRRTLFATDPESTPYALGCVLVRFGDDNRGEFVATDGRRLAIHRVQGTKVFPGENNAWTADVPTGPKAQVPLLSQRFCKALDSVLGTTKEDDIVQFAFKGDGDTWVRAGNATLRCRNNEGRFPHFEDIIPNAYTTSVEIGHSDIQEIIEQSRPFTTEDQKAIRLYFHGGQQEPRFYPSVAIETEQSNANEPSYRRGFETITHNGPDQMVSLDPTYILEFLKSLPKSKTSHRLTIKMNDHKGPIGIFTGDTTYIVMPRSFDEHKEYTKTRSEALARIVGSNAIPEALTNVVVEISVEPIAITSEAPKRARKPRVKVAPVVVETIVEPESMETPDWAPIVCDFQPMASEPANDIPTVDLTPTTMIIVFHADPSDVGTVDTATLPEQQREWTVFNGADDEWFATITQRIEERDARRRERAERNNPTPPEGPQGVPMDATPRPGFLGTPQSGFLGTPQSGFLGTPQSGFLGVSLAPLSEFSGCLSPRFTRAASVAPASLIRSPWSGGAELAPTADASFSWWNTRQCSTS